MTWASWLLLVVAGVGSGLVGYGAGLASLVSYPALLAVGLPPVVANMSNTVGVVGVSVGGAISARVELAPQRPRVVRYLAAGVLGGLGGALLLLWTPTTAFERAVPVLVAFASVAVVVGPRLRERRWADVDWRGPGMFVVVAAVSLYGGYFGAAAGVLLLALFGVLLDGSYPELNALKTVILGAANVAASAVFAVVGHVSWPAAAAVGIGAIAGSAAAPPIVRRVPASVLRTVVALAGLGLAISLGVDAYRP